MNKLLEFIKSTIDYIYYWPNNGNLGDLLIAEATRQYFRRVGIKWKEYRPETPPDEQEIVLVYGGGGRFTSHWGGIDVHLEHLTHSRVKTGIILPHSFFNVDWFILALDERHTLICREERSYNYCNSLSPKASVLLGDDMGLQLKIDELRLLQKMPERINYDDEEEVLQYTLLQQGFEKHVLKSVRNSSIICAYEKQKLSTAFLLRTDKEKSSLISSPLSFDISRVWNASCRETAFSAYFIRIFAEAIAQVEVIVTDRLHVGIMAYLNGKEVYLLDNDYGKLGGVYKQSLSDKPNVHLLTDGNLTPDLEAAWKKFNSPGRIVFYKIIRFIKCRSRFPICITRFFIRKLTAFTSL